MEDLLKAQEIGDRQNLSLITEQIQIIEQNR